ncbi:MAG TPA: methyltransferase domain-containing protein [Conexibacter sp.]|nr:methyltransferase domain-containing protein [Conexibacter sp.]
MLSDPAAAASAPTESAVAELARYLDQGVVGPPPPPISGGRLIRLLPAWGPGLLRHAGTGLSRPRSKRKWDQLPTDGSVRLHLGCGWAHKPDWVNVDLFATSADVVWDLRHGIPLPDNTVAAIFHEHMLEHLSLRDGHLLAQECLRVLAPGGVLRIGVPDAGLCIDSYAGKADPDWAQSRPTGMLAVQALFYEHGHQSMWDGETLTRALLAAGFADARRTDFGESWIEPPPDSQDRRDGTLYAEARKGA